VRTHRLAVRSFVAAVALTAAPHGFAGPDTAQVWVPARLPLLEPAIVEYHWTFLAPEWVVEPRKVDTRVYAPTPRVTRIDYGVVELKTERRRIARIADFSCKYSDFALPNECRTTWRDVHIDVPVPVVRRDYVDVDVPQWSWQVWRTTVEVPRLVWKQEKLVVSLPAFVVDAAPSR
jgi:hypothetical protein